MAIHFSWNLFDSLDQDYELNAKQYPLDQKHCVLQASCIES